MPKNFWLAVAVAVGLFGVMAAGHGLTVVAGTVPNGILDHQAAQTAARVADIHLAWRREGGFLPAQLLLGVDFLFILTVGAAALIGGRALIQARVLALGGLVLVAGLAAVGLDLGETGAQALQLWPDQPREDLASFAANCQPLKFQAYGVLILSCAAGLVLSRLRR
jgi:hypothetical protein